MNRKHPQQAKSIRLERFRSRAMRDLTGAAWPEERRVRDGLPEQLVPMHRQPKVSQ